jgi:glucosamine--fructose-6-phosphate aminotransferase (isomerizing)
VSEPGALMAAEIAEQPHVLQHLLDHAADVEPVARAIEHATPRFVLFAARGTSDHAALYGKYLAEIGLRLPAGLASPSSLTVYGARPDLRDVLFVAVSQSGGSPDLVDSVRVARGCGALTVAVTNSPDSPLAGEADYAVDVMAGAERAVAATKTYTAELLALYLLLGGTDARGRAAALPELAARTLALGRTTPVAERLAAGDRVLVSARGYSYATAREAALKLMETSYLSAHAYSGADLLHGPLALVDAALPVVAIASPGRGGAAMMPVVERLRATGAGVALVGAGEDAELRIAADGLAEELLPVLEILPLQLLAREVAVLRGVDPDRPRGLSKVTRTW